MTPDQERRRERFEALIGAMAPALDLMLAIGDRVSRRFASAGPQAYPIPALEPGPASAAPEDETSA
jgi:hypothetical protein